LLVAVCVCACDARAKPLREWRPEDHGQPAESDPARMPAEPQQAAAPAEPEAGGTERAAAALWTVSCASCHGRSGRGDGPARPPGTQPPDFSSVEFQKSRSDAQLAEVIVHGRNMMPPFGRTVNEQGVAALVAHIRTLVPPAGAAGAAPGAVAPDAPSQAPRP
jgi:cytochrome c oxidase cbb3-type subunit 3